MDGVLSAGGTIHHNRHGSHSSRPGKRRTALQADVDSMLSIEFADRILPFDEQAARAFSQIAAKRRSCGRPIGDLDAQIVAIAFSRGASVATRDVRDFEDCGVTVLNPWAGAQS